MDRIGTAAAKVFGRRGFIEATMEDIAAAAETSKGGLYYYFRTKAEVLFFIVSKTMDDLLRELPDQLAAAPSGDARLRLLIARQLAYYGQNMSAVSTMLNDRKSLPGGFKKVAAEKEAAYYRIVEKVIGEVVSAETSHATLVALTFSFFGLCNWIPSWYKPNGPLGEAQLADIVHSLFTTGLAGYRST